MSWLVAPQCSQAPCSGPSSRRNAATSAATGTPALAMPSASAAGSIATSREARSIARPLTSGITPRRPSTRASAPSTSSIARTSAPAAKSAATSVSP